MGPLARFLDGSASGSTATCSAWFGIEATAEDLFQQTWVRAVERIGRYDPRREFAPWLFAVARNLAIDELRRLRPESLEEADEPDGHAGAAEDVERRYIETFERDERVRRVRNALGQLSAWPIARRLRCVSRTR